jgi:hypothetical protein
MFEKTRTNFAIILAASLIVFLGRPVQAHVMSIPVVNFSFEANDEQPSATDGAWTTTIANWTTDNTALIVVRNPTDSQFAGTAGDGALPAPANGIQALCNMSMSDTGQLKSLALDIPALWQDGTPLGNGVGGLQHGITYTLTVSIGQALDSTAPPANTSIGFGTPTFSQNLIYNFGSWIGGYHPTGGFEDLTFSLNFDNLLESGGGVFAPVSVGDPIALNLTLGPGVFVDNVRVSITDVPEPTTLCLLGPVALTMFVYAGVRRCKD